MERLRQLIHEIHRRSLWQVLGIYVVASGAVLGGVGTLGDVLVLPEWFSPLAFALLIVGLPLVLATAFVQEGGPRREAGDVEVASPPSGTSSLFTWRRTFGGGVLAFALLGFVGTGWVLFGGGLITREAPGPIEQSVAVMPCTDLSPGGDQAPLAQGLAEGIINALARLPDLKVIGITSVIALLEENAGIETISETLDVATVLECGLQQAGGVIQIGTRLVEAASGAVLWSEEINGPAEDIFEIQDAVARAVTDQLQVVFAGGDETRIVAQGTTVPEAHQAYQLGRFFWNQRTGESIRFAITEFERAIGLDPAYAEAWSGLADSYLLVDQYSLIEEPTASIDHRGSYTAALDAARQAIDLVPDLGMGHTSLGYAFFRLGDWMNAQQEFEKSIELSPGYATAHQWYGDFLSNTGRAAEGVPHVQRAFELDPVSRVISRNLGNALWAAERRDDAIEQDRRAVQLHPDFPATWSDLSMFLLQIGQYVEGLEAWEMSSRLAGAEDLEARRELYEAAIRSRQTGESQRLSNPEVDHAVTSRHQALLYAYAGQTELALGSTEEMVRQGAFGMVAHQHVFLGDLLGDDPRYQALLEEAGITW